MHESEFKLVLIFFGFFFFGIRYLHPSVDSLGLVFFLVYRTTCFKSFFEFGHVLRLL